MRTSRRLAALAVATAALSTGAALAIQAPASAAVKYCQPGSEVTMSGGGPETGMVWSITNVQLVLARPAYDLCVYDGIYNITYIYSGVQESHPYTFTLPPVTG